ncbi:Ig-like domain-containing protein [Paludisphaera sp.]|uniref:Ig-like domain-containing protein n=1 Tax=Paludisphaera sp. TaxID=2017432 RepID=UPI00301D8FED
MDRRRFIPGPESMEVRVMLSTASPASVAATTASMTTNANATNLPITIQDKMTRIERLPINLRATERNRPLPRELVEPIQQAMTDSISAMGRADPQTIEMFNGVLRDVVSRPSLRAQDAQALNNALTKVLVSAGATTENVDTIATNLKALATTVNTTQSQPVFLTTNDYATVLQMTLIVGQPMPAPNLPTLARGEGASASNGHFVTRAPTPTFAGTYQAQAILQIYDDATGEVYGQGQAAKGGQYSIAFDRSLTDGETVKVRIRAVDELGHVGLSSRPFTIKYVARPGRA